ncbi:MAG: zinc-binding dehydrogenase [Bauldia sp.]
MLVTGANGGRRHGDAELLRLNGNRTLAAASSRAHDLVRSLGATAVESRAQAIDVGVHKIIPGGVDITLDNLGGPFTPAVIRATRKGGLVVGIGFCRNQETISLPCRCRSAAFSAARCWPGGRQNSSVSPSFTRRTRRRFARISRRSSCWPRDGKIHPRIAARLPLLAARKAAEMMEKGGVDGKIVHLAGL